MVGNIKLMNAVEARKQSQMQFNGLIEEQTSVINRYIKESIKSGLLEAEIPLCKIPKYDLNKDHLFDIFRELGYNFNEITKNDENDKLVIYW
jgi:hypothetical protein